MIGETNYATKIATLSDWLNNVAPVFNQWKEKLKLITPCICDFFSRAFSKFQVIAKNWFIALSVPVLIGRSNVITLTLVFGQSFENGSLTRVASLSCFANHSRKESALETSSLISSWTFHLCTIHCALQFTPFINSTCFLVDHSKTVL